MLGSDWGLGVLFVRPNSKRLDAPGELTWENYAADRVRLLRIVDEARIKRFINEEAVTGVEPVAGLVPIVELSAVRYSIDRVAAEFLALCEKLVR